MLEAVSEYWLTWLGVAGVVVLVWVAAVLSKYVRLLLNIVRERPGIPGVAATEGLRAIGDEVTFRALDGTRLRGMFVRQCAGRAPQTQADGGRGEDWLDARTRGVVIYCHEYGSDMHGCVRYCRGLLEAGFAVLRSISAVTARAPICEIICRVSGARTRRCPIVSGRWALCGL